MKFFLPVFAAAAALATTAQAAQCSDETLEALRATPEYKAYMATDCYTRVPVTTPCGQIKCLVNLEAVVAVTPDCENKGVNLYKDFSARATNIRAQCKADGSTPAPKKNVATIPPSVAAGGVADCTSAELMQISKDQHGKAWEAACMSPPGTAKDDSTKKTCGKDCFDAWRRQLDDRPHCLLGGSKYYEDEEANFADVKSLCAKETGNSTETTSAATSAPSSTTEAPASTTDAPSTTTAPSTTAPSTTAPATKAPAASASSAPLGVGFVAAATIAVAVTLV